MENKALSFLLIAVVFSLVWYNKNFADSYKENPPHLQTAQANEILSSDRPFSLQEIGEKWHLALSPDAGKLKQPSTNHSSDETLSESTPAVPSPPPPVITAKSHLVYNLTRQEILSAHNPDLVWPMASLTKFMTATVAVENIGFDVPIEITLEAINTPELAGWFYANEVYTVRDLLASLFLVSSNDSAVALSLHLGEDNFKKAMNAKAASLGMLHTQFFEPSGLNDNNISTASDLVKLVSYIYTEKPELLYFSRQKTATITDLNFGHIKNYTSINEFAGQSNFIGGKTGFTDIARGNLISLFSRNNQAILIIVLGTDNRFDETRQLFNWVKEIIK